MKRHSLIFALSLLVLLAVVRSEEASAPLFGEMQALTDSNMEQVMNDSNVPVWLVTFYVPWCEHTKTFAPKLEKASTEIVADGYNMKFGSVDVSQNKQVGWKYQIDRSPLLKMFYKKDDQWESTDYSGAGDIESVTNFCKEFYRGTSIPYSNLPDDFIDGDVLYLDENDFDDVIFSSNEIWMIKFSAPWCYHCNLMLPNWNAAAKEMGPKVRFAVVNADKNRSLARRFFVRMLPTIKYFEAGYGKTDEKALTYSAGRSEKEILDFAKKLRAKYDEDPSKYLYVPKYDYVQNLEPKSEISSPELACTRPDCSLLPSDLDDTELDPKPAELPAIKPEPKPEAAPKKIGRTCGPDCIYCKMMKDLKTGDMCVLDQFGSVTDLFQPQEGAPDSSKSFVETVQS